MVEWGAKTIPEGGFYSVPDRRYGHGIVLLGDAAGLLNVPSLKGIHYAMQSGIFAARAIFDALRKGESAAPYLEAYDELVNDSFILDDLYRTRNMRLAFKNGFLPGRRQGELDDAERRTVVRQADPCGAGRGCTEAGGPAEAVHARWEADVQQGRCRVQVRQRNARHGSFSSHRERRRRGRSREDVREYVSGRSVRSGGRAAARECAELCRLQSPRMC